MNPCREPGCESIQRTAGLCGKHYRERRQNTLPPCSEEDCENKGFSRGMCVKHYNVWRDDQRNPERRRHAPKAERVLITFQRQGSISSAWTAWEQGDMARVVDELLARTQRDGDCYRWADAHTSEGYGYIGAGKRGASMKAHRMMYIAAYGEQPITVHHTCAVRDCINPGHLQSVSSQTNTAEMLERNAYHKRIKQLESMVLDLGGDPRGAPKQAIRV